ncbi:N-acetyltransferase [Acerihabitans sp. TG2]|uniref:N-acetyltransferase n=1 Tax=Acerihabitans sp. TG2 TaxID=3096008 RepID=UPI002B236E57|nr:N-acetyltransferase [Acerihabitans sp. TG2]MEA9389966.1 N-acetyltransferase [Acerihabitans sp. TG2]
MIRPFQSDDIPELLALWLESTTLAHPFIRADYWLESLPLVRDEYLPQSLSWVDERDGEMTGFISILMGQFIGAVFVAPRYYHQGIGQGLLAQAKQRFTVLALEVYQLNHRARHFYWHQDFRQIGKNFNAETGHTLLTLQWRRH